MKQFLPVLLCILFCFHCQKSNRENSGPGQKSGGVLNITCLGSVENLDPQQLLFATDWHIASIVYEGLVTYGKKPGEIKPLIAKNWQILNEGTKYIFSLRDDVYFHDNPCFPNGQGRRLTARDVLFTFRRIAGKKTNNPNWHIFQDKIAGINDFHEGKRETIFGIKIISPFQLEFTLTRPHVNFLKLLATPTAYLVPQEAVDFYRENFKKFPVGTGPFRLTEWQNFEHIYLTAAPNYWQRDETGNRLPYLAGINVVLLSNPVQKQTGFLNQNLHLISMNQSDFQNLREESKVQNQFKVAGVSPRLSIRLLAFSLDKATELANSAKLRSAIAMAMRRQDLASSKNIETGLAQTLVPNSLLPGNLLKWYDFDLETARLLKENSLRNKKVETVTISSNLESRDIFILKKAFADLNLTAEIFLDAVDYYRQIIVKRPDVFRISFQPSYPDPEEYYSLFYSKSPPHINLTRYKNGEYDLIFEQLIFEQDAEIRDKLCGKLEQILKRDVPVIYLSNSEPTYFVAQKYLYGLKVHYLQPNYSEVWLNLEDKTSE